MPQTELPRVSPPTALQYCLLNWIIPGAGFFAVGDKRRGIVLFVIINVVLLTGLLYGGYIAKPSFSTQDPSFNLVGILTYIVEAFHGGGWMLMQFLHSLYSDSPDAFFNLERMAAKPYSDLGTFHLVVAGGLNYFASVRLYDLLAGNPELTETLKKEEESAGEDQEAGEDSGK